MAGNNLDSKISELADIFRQGLQNNPKADSSKMYAAGNIEAQYSPRRGLEGYRDPNIKESSQFTKQGAGELYTPDQQRETLEFNKGNQQTVQGNWNKEAKDKIVGWWDSNLAKDNPRGNLNGMDYQQTLNRSRMADAFNNRLDWEPSSVGRTTYHLGNVEGDTGKAYRRQPIDTQEMRQMRANEQVDAYARQRQAGLQGDMDKYGLDLQRQSDTNQASLAQNLGMSEIELQRNMQRIFQDASFTQPNSMQLQQKLNEFIQYLAFEVGTKKAQYLVDTYNTVGPVVASYVSSVLSGHPGMSLSELMYSNAMTDAINNSGVDNPREALRMWYQLTAEMMTQNAGGMVEGATEGAKDTAKHWWQGWGKK